MSHHGVVAALFADAGEGGSGFKGGAGESLALRCDGGGCQAVAVVEDTEVYQRRTGVVEEILDGFGWQVGPGTGRPTEHSEPERDGVNAVLP